MALTQEARARLEPDAAQIIGRYPQAAVGAAAAAAPGAGRGGLRLRATASSSAPSSSGWPRPRSPRWPPSTPCTSGGRSASYHVGVCTNSLCAVMGGDAIFADLQEHLGIGNDETTADGKVSLEHLECNAACDYAPVDDGQLGVLRQHDPAVGQGPGRRAARRAPTSRRPAARRGCAPGSRPRGSWPASPTTRPPAATRPARPAWPACGWPRSRAGRPTMTTATGPDAAQGAPRDHGADPRADRALGRGRTPSRWRPTGATAATRRCPRPWPWSPTQVIQTLKDSVLRGRGGAGFPTGREVGLHPAGRRQAALPGGQRRRVRAGRLQGHAHAAGQPAGADRGHHHRRLRDPGRAGLHLRARRGAARDPAAAPRRRRGHGRRATWAPTSWAPGSTWTSSCTPARAPTSAARRRRCSTRWRASAASPGSSPRSRRWPGLYACPTVVNNVESIATVPYILKHGARRTSPPAAPSGPRASGSSRCPATSPRPGQYEAPLGTTLRELLDLAGGIRAGHRLKFWTPGGSSTPLFTDEHLDVPLDYESVAKAGLDAGHPVGAALRRDHLRGPRRAAVDRVLRARVVRQVHARAGRAATGWSSCWSGWSTARAARPTWTSCWTSASNITGRAFCALGDSIQAPVESSIKYFRDEYLEHQRQGGCPFDPAASTLFAMESA